MFERRAKDHPYPPRQTRRYLAWLAQEMTQHSQTVLLTERMQPSWLQTGAQRRRYRIIPISIFALFFGLLVGLTSGLIFRLVLGPGGWLIGGLILGLEAWGGKPFIQHFALRFVLYRNGYLPRNLVRFLDFATERIFLRKVGGGYIFVHRLLQDYFASLDQSPIH